MLADAPSTTAYQAPTHWSGAGLSGTFFLLSLLKTARGLGLLRQFRDFLRGIFKQRGWYEDRRSLQIAASIAVAVLVMALVVWGLRWSWHRIKRYRLAVGFAGLTSSVLERGQNVSSWPRLFSNSGPAVKTLQTRPCRVHGSLRGRGMPSA